MATATDLAADIQQAYGSLLRRKDIAEYLRCSTQTVDRLTKNIQPAVGKRYFYKDVAKALMTGGAPPTAVVAKVR